MEGFNWSILAWIGGLIFVYLFGLFEGRGQGRKKRIAEEQTERSEEQPPVETITVDDAGILRVKNDNGSFQLDLDGQRVEPTDFTSFQRRRLISILNALRPWVDDKHGSATQPPEPKPVPAAQPVRAAPVPPEPSTPPKAPVTTPVSAAAPRATTPKAKDEIETAPISIVGQINLILQDRIRNTPLEARNITLSESMTGGVNVFVGIHRFEGVDEVPDEDVKSAIRGAIQEWERRFTPGMR